MKSIQAQDFPHRIGTRNSLLAQTQTQHVLRALQKARASPFISKDYVIVPIKTSGDQLSESGQVFGSQAIKGLFAKELDEALLTHRIDLAVHSMKDLDPYLPEGIKLAAVLPREDCREAWISREDHRFEALPPGSTVGTSAPRRAAQIQHHRPDLKVVPIRGNVPTRLEKLKRGEVDALILAYAGLRRLGLEQEITHIFEKEDFIPAVAQGIIAITCRSEDLLRQELLSPIDDKKTGRCAEAEWTFLKALDGSCKTPIGGYADWTESVTLTLTGLIAAPDGSALYQTSLQADTQSPQELGIQVAETLKDQAGGQFAQWKDLTHQHF